MKEKRQEGKISWEVIKGLTEVDNLHLILVGT